MRYYHLIIVVFMSLGAHGQPRPPIYRDSTFINTILQEHNVYRAELQLPPLVWSAGLAADAKAWALHLAEANKGDHDASIRGQEGENIWWGTSEAFTVAEMTDFWGNEKKGFVYGVFPDCKIARSTVVGHYTQVIWKTTTSVGCALASNGKMDYLVCRYSPAGNLIGQKPY